MGSLVQSHCFVITDEMMKRRAFYATATLPADEEQHRPTPEMYVPNEKISISLEFSPK